MTRTYAAILHGDRLEWTGDAPSSPEIGRAIPVTVVVEDAASRPGGEDPEAWNRAVDALRRLAARVTFAQIADPVESQREVREDRPLPAVDRAERGRRMREALDRLAASGAFEDITDPVAWQREIRKDRPLPGRDDERPSSTTR